MDMMEKVDRINVTEDGYVAVDKDDDVLILLIQLEEGK